MLSVLLFLPWSDLPFAFNIDIVNKPWRPPTVCKETCLFLLHFLLGADSLGLSEACKAGQRRGLCIFSASQGTSFACRSGEILHRICSPVLKQILPTGFGRPRDLLQFVACWLTRKWIWCNIFHIRNCLIMKLTLSSYLFLFLEGCTTSKAHSIIMPSKGSVLKLVGIYHFWYEPNKQVRREYLVLLDFDIWDVLPFQVCLCWPLSPLSVSLTRHKASP